MNPDQNGVKSWQWVVTVIVIIILIIVGILVFSNKSDETTLNTNNNPVDTSTDATTGGNRIVMSDQYPGNVINVSSVQFAQPGWVVIHKNNGGSPGAIIGQTYFSAGFNTGKVSLSEMTIQGGTYYAMLHSDDGDKKFDATKDLPLKDSKGDIIMQIFKASTSAGSEIKG